jgi:hypothetical protein
MLICKMFSGTNPSKVEDEVNVFFQKSPQITVHSICQSSDSQRVFISVFFNVKTKTGIEEASRVEQVESIVAKAEVRQASDPGGDNGPRIKK